MTKAKFRPRKGQIDFTNARYAPVINIVLAKDNKILLVKRSNELHFYPGYWNGISGFLDDSKSIEEKAKEELLEELGIKEIDLGQVEIGQPFLQEAPEYRKTWIVIPVKVEAKTDKIKLDREAQEAKWFKPGEILKIKLLPDFERVVGEFFSL